jgi:hypothetical protein
MSSHMSHETHQSGRTADCGANSAAKSVHGRAIASADDLEQVIENIPVNDVAEISPLSKRVGRPDLHHRVESGVAVLSDASTLLGAITPRACPP